LKFNFQQNAVTRLLQPREVELAYRLFHVFDSEGSGQIQEYDARKAVASWYTLFLETDDNLNGFVFNILITGGSYNYSLFQVAIQLIVVVLVNISFQLFC